MAPARTSHATGAAEAGPRLRAATAPGWFAAATRDLGALLSDHFHCERKAAENALHLLRRYPVGDRFTKRLAALAHEETRHLGQVAAALRARELPLRPDTPNRYARALLAELRPREPQRRVDALLVAALIEARSHERLQLLARGFAAAGERELAALYDDLAEAEDRHAALYVALAREIPRVPTAEIDARLAHLAEREARIVAGLPHAPRVH